MEVFFLIPKTFIGNKIVYFADMGTMMVFNVLLKQKLLK